MEHCCAPQRDALLLITTSPALRATYVDAAAVIAEPPAAAIVERVGLDRLRAPAAVGVALREWLPAPSTGGLVVPRGSLPDVLRSALVPLRPALDAAAS